MDIDDLYLQKIKEIRDEMIRLVEEEEKRRSKVGKTFHERIAEMTLKGMIENTKPHSAVNKKLNRDWGFSFKLQDEL